VDDELAKLGVDVLPFAEAARTKPDLVERSSDSVSAS
jgi:hypothetical protein